MSTGELVYKLQQSNPEVAEAVTKTSSSILGYIFNFKTLIVLAVLGVVAYVIYTYIIAPATVSNKENESTLPPTTTPTATTTPVFTTTPVPTTTPMATTPTLAPTFTLFSNNDLNRDNLGGGVSGSLAICQTSCNNNSNCTGFVIDKANTQNCFLKQGTFNQQLLSPSIQWDYYKKN